MTRFLSSKNSGPIFPKGGLHEIRKHPLLLFPKGGDRENLEEVWLWFPKGGLHEIRKHPLLLFPKEGIVRIGKRFGIYFQREGITRFQDPASCSK
jgi:hypothetical protein